ncbi:MAG TPA: isocitrate lyase/phosphoenolpyruvate mutase family protein [Candidatus Eisenbacteria bacterium]|nr:isocitrate lyase/phosphoenolpyruvate mutase family protein [Candidatus Eisenbacteria bacterium]
MPTLHEKARAFAERHRGPGMIVLPNAWDPGSAIVFADAGFPCMATTSSGIAFAQGVPDGEVLSRSRMLELVAQIAEAVDVPVSADLEAGYGPRPEDVAATVEGAFAAGAVGCNIEDATDDRDHPLLELELAVERIRAGAEAARATGAPFVLNARADPYLVRMGTPEENLAESIRRANAYRQAGADCLFVPGVADPDAIATLVREIDGPLNVLGARGGGAGQLSMADLEALGVRRVSIGGSLALAVAALVRRAATELRDHGTVSYTRDAMSNAEANALMRAARREG